MRCHPTSLCVCCHLVNVCVILFLLFPSPHIDERDREKGESSRVEPLEVERRRSLFGGGREEGGGRERVWEVALSLSLSLLSQLQQQQRA